MERSEASENRFAERAPLYWAVLAAAWFATTGPVAAQSAPVGPERPQPPQPSGAETEDPVTLEADIVNYDETAGTIVAEGNVQARYEDRILHADRITYNLADGTIRAQGNVQLVNPDGSVSYADELEVDEALNLGVATELQARVGETGRFAARTAIRRNEGISELSNIIYTSCPICEDGSRPPTWALRARRAVQNTETRTISYQGATLEVAGVPILYLPYFAHPDPSAGPTSGFLTPEIGRNRRLGAFYGQPYAWVISPYSDLTIGARVHENVRPLGSLEYRKRFYSGDLTIATSFTYEQDFDGDGELFGSDTYRSHVFAQGRFDINNYWSWGFGAERASDDLYLRRYGIDGAGDVRGPFVGDRHRLLSQLYTQGQGQNSFVTVNLLSFQGLREDDESSLLPLILPFGEFEYVWRDPFFDGQIKLRGSTAVLERFDDGVFDDADLDGFDDDVDTARGSLGVAWRGEHVIGPGLVFSPFAEGRFDAYRIADPSQPEEDTFTRGVGMAGAEISWPFLRTGETVDILVEPIAMAAVSTGDNDPRIVNEDSITFELDDSNLFRPNAAPNYDIWETGSRLSLGVRTTVRTQGGESATFLFGRRWREDDDPIFTPDTNLDGTASDYVAAATIDLGPHFGAQIRTRLEDESLEVNRIDALLRGSLGRFSAQARYFSLDDSFFPGAPSQEIYANVGVQLIRGWEMQFGLRRDLDSDINLSQDLRAIYRDDCTFLELSYTRSETRDRGLGPNEGFQIRVGLTSLGVFGGGD